jgi:hypothetical protein
MSLKRHVIEIVHPGTPERAVARWKSRGLDEMRFNAETGGKPENRTGILWDIGLE